MLGDDWVKFVDTCGKCGTGKGPFGGVYARGKRMSVCIACYVLLTKDPVAYGKQVKRYRAQGL